MSAPLLWIFLPAGIGLLLGLLRNQKIISLIATLVCVALTIVALALPIDAILTVGNWQFKIAPSVSVLGRRLTLLDSDRALLALLYSASALWYGGAASASVARRLIPLGMSVTALLLAALSVQPALFAILLLEIAALASVPLLSTQGQRPGKGLLRFLSIQTLAMMVLLLASWTMSGVEANPGDIALVSRSLILLGAGFALLLAIFPFHTWLPLLAEEAHPYPVGWLFWLFPTTALFLGLDLLNRYAWLREAVLQTDVLEIAGFVMIVVAGLLAFFERNIARLFGYAVILETGFSLLALSLPEGRQGLFFLLLAPRLFAYTLWAYALAIFYRQTHTLNLKNLQAAGTRLPIASIALILATFSITGLPMLASFPAHQAIWLTFARQGFPQAGWILLGSVGVGLGGIRMLNTFFTSTPDSEWTSLETPIEKILLGVGIFLLFLQGIFPQAFALW